MWGVGGVAQRRTAPYRTYPANTSGRLPLPEPWDRIPGNGTGWDMTIWGPCPTNPAKWDSLGHGPGEDRMRSGNSPADGTPGLESVLELRLMALLTDMVRAHGMGGAAERLGVSRKTMWRARASGTLPPSLLAVLERLARESDEAAATAQGERTGALESRVQELEGKLEAGLQQVHAARTAIEEQGEGVAEGVARHLGEVERRLGQAETALREGHVAHHDRGRSTVVRRSPDGGRQGVVSAVEPPDGDEDTHGAAAPLVAEWRRLYGGGVDDGDRLDRAVAEERMRELELELIVRHGLTLPPATMPWSGSDRRSQAHSRRMTLTRVRGERIRAQWRRRARRALTLGLWR